MNPARPGALPHETAPAPAFWWRLLGWSFLLGALVDLAFGAAILMAAEPLAPVMGLTLPTPPVYLDLNGLLLIGLGGIYFLVFTNPRRFAPVAAVATLLRFGGAALFVRAVLTGRGESFFLTAAQIDAGLALFHAFFLYRAAGGLSRVLTTPEEQLP